MQSIINAEGLGKQYHIGPAREPYQTLRDSFTRTIKAPFRHLRRNKANRNDTVWALKNLDLAIAPGEVVGVIGRNGAGKSTLLKVLSRITEPTTGKVDLYGRVASLLEVGTGFHPELTGRENIYLNGAILGMGKREITGKFDEIVEFAEVEKFIETPVKRYSSGMYLRLAFAVAAHMDPEILLVDEVLAVGDAQFQKKCLGRMTDIGKEGRTILFVSHNLVAVQGLCQRVVWLDSGREVECGSAAQVVSNYLRRSSEGTQIQVWESPDIAPGDQRVKIRSAAVRPSEGIPGDRITVLSPIAIEFEYWNFIPNSHLNLSLHIIDEHGAIVFATVSLCDLERGGRPFSCGLFRSTCLIPGSLLNDGAHRVLLLVVKDESEILCRLENILAFDVHDVPESRGNWHGKWPGAVRPRLDWKTEEVFSASACSGSRALEDIPSTSL